MSIPKHLALVALLILLPLSATADSWSEPPLSSESPSSVDSTFSLDTIEKLESAANVPGEASEEIRDLPISIQYGDTTEDNTISGNEAETFTTISVSPLFLTQDPFEPSSDQLLLSDDVVLLSAFDEMAEEPIFQVQKKDDEERVAILAVANKAGKDLTIRVEIHKKGVTQKEIDNGAKPLEVQTGKVSDNKLGLVVIKFPKDSDPSTAQWKIEKGYDLVDLNSTVEIANPFNPKEKIKVPLHKLVKTEF